MSRNAWILFILILAMGLLLRASYLRELVHEPDFAHPALDPQFHDYWARALVSGDWTPPPRMPDPQIPSTPYGRPPGYPYFLALIYLLSGSSFLAARLVQMALGIANIVLAFAFARKIFGTAAALIAAACMAGYWGLIYFEGELESPVVEVTLVLLWMHALRWWWDKPAFLRAAVAGLLFGLFVLFRTNALLAAPVILIWMVWVLWKKQALRRAGLTVAISIAATAAVIAPVTLRNYRVSGEPFLITYNSGVNLYIGNNAQTDCVMPMIPELRKFTGSPSWTCFHYPMIVRGIARELGKDSITYADADRYFRNKAWDFIRQHSGDALKFALKRAALFWGPAEITSNRVTYYDKLHSATLRYIPGFPLAAALFLLGIAGLIADAWSRRQRESEDRRTFEITTLMLAFIFVYFASFLPFLVSGRFRIVLIPLLATIGAYAIVRVARQIKNASYGRAAAWSGAGVALFALAHVQLVPYAPELDYWHFQRGSAFEAQGDPDNAAQEYEAAIDAHGEFTAAMPHAALGDLRARQAKPEEAVRWYQLGLQIAPNDPYLHHNLARVLADRGETPAAIKHYRRALQADPANPRMLNNLALALAADGKHQEAVETYRRALLADPGFAVTYCNLAVALANQGQFDEALALYDQGLRIGTHEMKLPPSLGAMLEKQNRLDAAVAVYKAQLARDPNNVTARMDLGNALISQEHVEEAVRQYQEVLRIDPNHRDALFDLGMVSAARGKVDAAIAYLGRAQALNPNDAAVAKYLGALLLRQGKRAEALYQYRRAVQLDPNDAQARDGLNRAQGSPNMPAKP